MDIRELIERLQATLEDNGNLEIVVEGHPECRDGTELNLLGSLEVLTDIEDYNQTGLESPVLLLGV